MMTYPGGMFHCSLGLMGEGSQPKYACVLCVHLPTVYDIAFTPGPVPLCCDAECHPALVWALQPEKPAVKLTGLSSELTFPSSLTDTHANTHNEAHTQTHSFMACGLSTHEHTKPPLPHHPHISRDHRTSCRRSRSCQPQTQSQIELGYFVATRNLNTWKSEKILNIGEILLLIYTCYMDQIAFLNCLMPVKMPASNKLVENV